MVQDDDEAEEDVLEDKNKQDEINSQVYETKKRHSIVLEKTHIEIDSVSPSLILYDFSLLTSIRTRPTSLGSRRYHLWR